VRIRLHNFGEYEHATSFTHEVEEDENGWVNFPELLQSSTQIRIEITSAQGRLQITNLVIEAADAYGRTLLETFERAFQFHSSKNLFGYCSSVAGTYNWCTYGSVWRRATDFARGLASAIAAANVSVGAGVALMAKNSQEWFIAQLAGWMIQKAVVAIAAEIPAAQLAGVVHQGGAEVMVTDRDLATIPKEILLVIYIGKMSPSRSPGDHFQTFCAIETIGKSSTAALPSLTSAGGDDCEVAMVLFTSGSSGRPKGVARTCRELNLLLHTYAVPQTAIHLSVQPLSHLSESVILPTIILQGGQIVFCDRTPDVLREMQMLRPTFIFNVPRFFEMLHGLFDDAVKELMIAGTSADEARANIIHQFRGRAGPIGDRVCVLSVGSAPVTPQLLQFMKQVWCMAQGGPAAVSHGYGSTECGTIAVDGCVFWGAKVLLVERADIKVSLDGPRPRGELLAHTPQVVRKYAQGDPSGFVVESTPYFRPGDLCETTAHSYHGSSMRGTLGSEWGDLAGCRYVMLTYQDDLEVVGRVKNCQKLSNGEFVSPESIEAALAAVEPSIVESLVVVVDVPSNCVVLLVVPLNLKMAHPSCRGQHEATLVKAFAAAASAAGLASYEVPTSVAILSEKWSTADGTLTSSNKVDRAGIEARFAADLRRLGVSADPEDREQTVDARVIAYLSVQSDEEASAIFAGDVFADGATAADRTLIELGGDSIAAARIRGSFSSKLDIGQVASLSIGELRKLVHGTSSTGDGLTAEYWESETVWAHQTRASYGMKAVTQHSTDEKVVLVTGVTGFIGPHLLSAISQRGRWSKIVVLVRPPLSRVMRLPGINLELIAADMAQKGFGLSDHDRHKLANISIDTVVHSAAHVDHIQTYRQLHATNVRACDELVAILAPSRPAFVFVSSVSAAGPGAGEDLDSTSADAVTSLGGGYGQTKWVAERRLAAALRAGCFRSLRIARLGLIGPHSRTGEHNSSDSLHLFLRAVAAAKAVPEMAADASIEMLPVDTAVAVLASMTEADAMRGVAPAISVSPVVRIDHVDARAAGIRPCLLAPLLHLAASVPPATGAGVIAGDKNAILTLPYVAWHGRVREVGGQDEKVLVVLPPPDAVPAGPFVMPSAAREDLQRGQAIQSIVAALPSFDAEPYGDDFLGQWASQFALSRK
jgi:fatty acid CoA ligase FadD9